MIFEQNEATLNAWKTEMHTYQKNKRTKKPFGQRVPLAKHITHEDIKTRQYAFDPITQVYRRQEDQLKAASAFEEKRTKSLINHLKNTYKHQKSFDIVNLSSNQSYVQQIPIRKMAPIRNAFNVINNQKIPDYFLKHRELKLPVERQKKLLGPASKQFNIISNVYNEKNEERWQEQNKQSSKQLIDKYWKSHDFNPVFGKYYDEHKEEQYQQDRRTAEQKHAQSPQQRFPPSYIYREPLIVDYSKPLPDSLLVLDERAANAKKRYQMKYIIADQYQKRNEQDEQRHQKTIKNHVHFGRVLDQKSKQFDIVTNQQYKQTRAQELYGKKLQISGWDQLVRQAAQQQSLKPIIKSAGFS